ncbi:MAG: MBL fold metallo-hydrolase [Chitinophagaceae bacterium]|nr:MBL fold metallo-hydrolase [Chitinophagaceae bacterium]
MQKLPTHNPSLSFIKENWSGNILNEKQQYINLDGPAEKSFAELLKWQTEKNPLKPAKKKQQTTVDVVTNHHITSNREDGVVWLGHASFLFTLSGKHFITDPVLYNVGPVKRFTPLPCDVDALKQIDFILLSHNHRDHCDQKSMQQLCALNPNAIILTGLNIAPLLRSWKIANPIIEAGWYQRYNIETDVAITYLPAKHWNRRGLADMNNMLWGSFMIEGSKQKIYFGADSGLGIHFAEIAQLFPGIDIAILGIGAYKPEWFMASAHTSPADALVAFAQLKAKQFIPMHHGTFDLSDEPIFYPKQELLLLQEKSGITAVEHLSIGNKMEF